MLLLETLLHKDINNEITHIFVRNHITYFKLHGESFCTAAGHVYHQSSPMFDSPPLRAWAEEAHTEHGKTRHQEMMESVEEETDLWMKHKQQIYKKIFIEACKVMVEEGDAAMENYIDLHFDIQPDQLAREMMKKL